MIFSAIIPIKLTSERLPNKNFKTLIHQPLFHYVLDTLHLVKEIDEIIIDTDCPEMLDNYLHEKSHKIVVLQRPTTLQGNAVVMNTLLKHSLNFAKHDHILQTHVTNPLLKPGTVERALQTYRQNLPYHDSLFSVTAHKKRFYNFQGIPVNHDLRDMRSTQDVSPIFEENSNLFVFSKQSFSANNHNRIGLSPAMFEMHPFESIDIDESHEFTLAEYLLRYGY